MLHRHTLTWVAIFGVISLMFLRLPPMIAKQDSVLNTYGPLVEVDALAKQQFVEPIHDDRLVEGAIRGMMLRLDPYSGYISPDELPSFERRNNGEYCGVGIEVGYRNGRLAVIAPIEGSPAAHAGVRPGDLVLAINGREVEGRSVFEVEDMLVGAPDTVVKLRVLHSGEREPTTFAIARGPVQMQTVRGFSRDDANQWIYRLNSDARIGYIRISNFRQNTAREFDRALKPLLSQGLMGLIIDLRFNPGGIMQQAIDLADRFLPDGIIVSTVTRRRAVEEFRAHAPDTVNELPIVVLINGGSASAAEIVAGSLQARRRATIVGERSFGKGSVQHLVKLTGHDAAVKLTTAYYRMPDGRIIHRTTRNALSNAWGIIPDVEFVLTDAEARAVQDARRTLDLAFVTAEPKAEEGASALPLVPSATDAAASPSTHGPSVPSRELPLDRQLEKGIDVLRSMVQPCE